MPIRVGADVGPPGRGAGSAGGRGSTRSGLAVPGTASTTPGFAQGEVSPLDVAPRGRQVDTPPSEHRSPTCLGVRGLCTRSHVRDPLILQGRAAHKSAHFGPADALGARDAKEALELTDARRPLGIDHQ
ncbi:MAG: hypothetical protein ACRDSP_01155 [Pseudonocardiaceae bacterium]